MKVILLPGLDGTGDLFYPFVDSAPDGWTTQVVRYPRDGALRYSDCADLVRGLLPTDEEYVILGESFSGPVALQLAAESPPLLRGVILCSSFARRPWWSGFKLLPWRAVFSLPLPGFVTRRLLGAAPTDPRLEEHLRGAVTTIPPRVLASRMHEVLSVDATAALESVQVPVLYLRGTQDTVVRRRSLAHVKARMPEVRVAELSTAHMVLQLSPVEAWQAVQTFGQRCLDPTCSDSTGQPHLPA